MSRNESLGLLSIGSFLCGWFTYFICYWPGDPAMSPLERFLATVFLLGAPGAYLVSIGTRYLTGYIPPPFSTAMVRARIHKLQQLQERGVPTDEEYRRQHTALLSSNEGGLVLLTFLFMVLFFFWHYALRHSALFFLAPLVMGLMPASLASRHVQRRFSLPSSVALGIERQHPTGLPHKEGN